MKTVLRRLLYSCTGSSSLCQTTPRQRPIASLLAILLGASGISAAETEVLDLVTVHRQDDNTPVQVRAIYCNRGRAYTRLNMEEKELGHYRVSEFSWEPNDRVHIVVDSLNRYDPPDPQPVKKRVDFVVTEKPSFKPTTEIEETLLDRVSNKRGPRDDIVIFTELANRLRPRDPALARAADQYLWTAAGEVFGVGHTMDFDNAQGRFVPSDELKSAIGSYQQRSDDLDVTRRLDGATMQAVADRPHWWYLYPVNPAAEYHVAPDRPSLPVGFGELAGALDDSEIAFLAMNAERALARHQPGLSALLMDELAVRLRRHGSEDALSLAVAAEFETYEALGRVLSEREPTRYDPVQGKFVLSPSLAVGLKQFQAGEGLERTGEPRNPTLRALAGVESVGPYLTGLRVPEER